MGLENIRQFTRDGQQIGATGQLLNTLWYDDGEALASNNWYGVLFGSAAAWQQGESSIPQFEASFGPAFHGDMTGKLQMAQQELMAAHDLLRFTAKVGDGSDGLFWLDPWSKDGQQYAEEDSSPSRTNRCVPHAEHAACSFEYGSTREAYPAPTTPVVYSMTNQSLFLQTRPRCGRRMRSMHLSLARDAFDFIGEKFQLADEMAEELRARAG